MTVLVFVTDEGQPVHWGKPGPGGPRPVCGADPGSIRVVPVPLRGLTLSCSACQTALDSEWPRPPDAQESLSRE